MAAVTGVAELDFGTGTVSATVTISGMSGLTSASYLSPFWQDDSTADNSADGHQFAASTIMLTARYVSATSFTITANSTIGLIDGKFAIRYVVVA